MDRRSSLSNLACYWLAVTMFFVVSSIVFLQVCLSQNSLETTKYMCNQIISIRLLLFSSKCPSHSGGGHDQAGVPPILQQERQTVLLVFLLLYPLHHPNALHGLPPLSLPQEFLPVGQGWGWASVGLELRPAGVKEPASPGESNLHQPAEQRVQ